MSQINPTHYRDYAESQRFYARQGIVWQDLDLKAFVYQAILRDNSRSVALRRAMSSNGIYVRQADLPQYHTGIHVWIVRGMGRRAIRVVLHGFKESFTDQAQIIQLKSVHAAALFSTKRRWRVVHVVHYHGSCLAMNAYNYSRLIKDPYLPIRELQATRLDTDPFWFI